MIRDFKKKVKRDFEFDYCFSFSFNTFDFLQDFLDFLLAAITVYVHFKNTSLQIKLLRLSQRRHFFYLNWEWIWESNGEEETWIFMNSSLLIFSQQDWKKEMIGLVMKLKSLSLALVPDLRQLLWYFRLQSGQHSNPEMFFLNTFKDTNKRTQHCIHVHICDWGRYLVSLKTTKKQRRRRTRDARTWNKAEKKEERFRLCCIKLVNINFSSSSFSESEKERSKVAASIY